jgi:hypothetical protein
MRLYPYFSFVLADLGKILYGSKRVNGSENFSFVKMDEMKAVYYIDEPV